MHVFGRRIEMRGSPDAGLPRETELHRFLDRALALLEWGGLAGLLAITLLQPTTGRLGLPSPILILLFAAYLLAVDLLRNRVRRLHAFRLKYATGLPVSALIYYLGGEPGGPLFALFFLLVVCAAATLTLREGLLYVVIAAALTAVIDTTFSGWSEGDLRGLGTRLLLLAVFGANTAILMRRVALERVAARSARDQSERLEELDRLRVRFVSSVSHGLRTPLTASRAALGLLESSAAGRLGPDERNLLENARRNTARLGRAIDDLLAFNQLEAGTLHLERAALDLREVVTEAMSAVYALIREKGQTLEMELPDLLPVNGDTRRLEQVLVNLLENAHLHTAGGTRIAVSGRASEAEVSLTVEDDGPGIPEGELENVFGRFYRLGPVEDGSGLGLAICRGIVELHGGRVWAEGRPGAGAAFRVVLPRAADGTMR